MAFETKVYIIQKYDRQGNPGAVIDAKLTLAVAQEIAKNNAPAKVIGIIADKRISKSAMVRS
ncbi:hypothetical protein EVB27_152 [Rhizobium phage RHph_TM16]|nr:hypothetical protein EVB27_152 [Rhizobium phage RHph_TM16]